MKQEALQFIEE